LAVVVTTWFLTRTRWGVHIYATGEQAGGAAGGREFSRLMTVSGVRGQRVCGGIAGLIATPA